MIIAMHHRNLGKLGSKCWGLPVMHKQLPLSDYPESQGSSKLSDMSPCTSISPCEKLKVLTNKVYTIFIEYEVWNVDTIKALTVDN